MKPRSPAELADISARTRAHYDANAEAFWQGTRDHDVSENHAAFLRAIERRPPFRILDLGCGPGRDVLHFRDLGHEAVGLDGAERFVAMARALTGCEVLHQDLLALDLGELRPFDGIFANASLFHVPTSELPRVLRALRDALVPRGVLFSSNPRGDDTEGFSGQRFGAFHSLEAWQELLRAAGFEEIEHYYRPAGRPRHEQPWLASVWRKVCSLHEAFDAGARLFDAGAFFDAHEAWEEHWRAEPDPDRRVALQGLVQVAAAYHKLLVVSDPASARRLFSRGLAKLVAFPRELSEHLDVEALRAAVADSAAHAEEVPFDRRRIPRLVR